MRQDSLCASLREAFQTRNVEGLQDHCSICIQAWERAIASDEKTGSPQIQTRILASPLAGFEEGRAFTVDNPNLG